MAHHTQATSQSQPAESSSSRLAPPSHFDIEMSEKEVAGGEDYDQFLNQQTATTTATTTATATAAASSSSLLLSRSGLSSSASSITVFDPTSSADREKAYHSDHDDDDDDDDYHQKEFSSSTPFLSSHHGHGDGEDEESAPAEPRRAAGPEHVTWMSLPHKGQLLILFLCRFVDFLQVATLQAYIFYQLKHMAEQQMLQDDGTETVLSDAQISAQAGLLTGGFTGAQVLTAIVWGKIADSPKIYGGRKMVLLIGTLGTAIGCFGYGFSSSFGVALCWRIFAGCVNGLVGIIRTMISEITVERKYQSRAFLILPMSFNVAGILGPIIGGWLADPVHSLPAWFGEGAVFHSEVVERYPFALPSLVNALFLFAVFLAVLFGLEETSKSKKGTYDVGLYMAARVKCFLLRRPLDYVYHSRTGYEQLDSAIPLDEKKTTTTTTPAANGGKKKKTLPFSRLWTRNVIFTLLSQALYDFHLGAFTNIWTLFLSTPRPGFAPSTTAPVVSPTDTTTVEGSSGAATTVLGKRNLLWFAGGLGMPASTVGNATSILGVLGMLLQVVMYPPVHARLGTLRSFRYFLIIFPVAYLLAPFLAVLPQQQAAASPGENGNGGGASAGVSTTLWFAIVVILFLHTSARTMTLPASIILLNNCSPHPSVLGTIHGLGQSVSAGFRTVGPIVGGWWYGMGLDWGMVAFSWWAVAGMSVMGWVASQLLYEGSGKEIDLDDDDEE